MDSLQRAGLAIMCMCLFGCGSSSEPEAPPESPPEPPPVEETVFGDMVGTMDKARGVQDTVDTHKQDLDRQMDAAEGSSAE